MTDNENPKMEKKFPDLPDSKDLLTSLFEQGPEPMFIADPAGCLIAVNDLGNKLLGYAGAEMLGKHIGDLVHPDDLALEAIPMEELRRGRILKRERRLLRKDGGVVSVENRFRMMPDGHILGITIDITAQKKAEAALRQSEKKYRHLYQHMHDGSAAVNLDGTIIEFNAAFQLLLGYDAEEIYSLSYEDITPAKWHGMEKKILEEQVLKRGYSDLYEKEYIARDGRVFPVELTTYLLRDDSGAPAGFWAIVRDITERKQAEDAVRREMMLSENIINSLPGIFYMYDDTNRLVRWNKRLEQDTGYPPGRLSGIDVLEFFADEQKPDIMSRMALVFTEGESFAEAPLLTRDGRQIPYFFTGRKVTLDGRQFMIGLGLDITEHQKIAAEKEALQEQLHQAQKMESMGRLAGGVAHDFNNMLSAILGQAELSMMEHHLPDQIHGSFKVIKESALRSAELVRQLLTFARKQAVAPHVMNLNNSVAGMLKMLHRLIGENIELVWLPGTDLWPVRIDPSQIDQLLVNLCVNARDAITGVGKITIETRNSVFDASRCAGHPNFKCGEFVMLSVSDNGSGMSQAVLDNLFEPFFTTKAVGKGTGLGLATVYGIVKQNEGFIDVRSDLVNGSTFRVYIPRFTGKTAEIMPAETEKMPKGHGETVLMVEDESVILDVSRKMMEILNYRVLVASTPDDALRLAHAHGTELDLLITDVIMPGMNGRDLAKKIRKLKPDLKCLFISGYTSDVIANQKVLEKGVQFLPKPFSMKNLADKVHQVLTEA